MQLTGKEIVEEQIIIGFAPEAVQQQGIDLRIAKIGRHGKTNQIGRFISLNDLTYKYDSVGLIPKEGKTRLPISEDLPVGMLPNGNPGWYLEPGYYEITYDEGCNVPENRVMRIKTRSSGVRCGIEINSGQYDAGFKTDQMGSYIRVDLPVMIEQHARIGQAIVLQSAKVENTYNGQWQGDKQRKN